MAAFKDVFWQISQKSHTNLRHYLYISHSYTGCAKYTSLPPLWWIHPSNYSPNLKRKLSVVRIMVELMVNLNNVGRGCILKSFRNHKHCAKHVEYWNTYIRHDRKISFKENSCYLALNINVFWKCCFLCYKNWLTNCLTEQTLLVWHFFFK